MGYAFLFVRETLSIAFLTQRLSGPCSRLLYVTRITAGYQRRNDPAPKFTLWTSLLLPRAGALPVFDFGAG
jgi:hypothetical protein